LILIFDIICLLIHFILNSARESIFLVVFTTVKLSYAMIKVELRCTDVNVDRATLIGLRLSRQYQVYVTLKVKLHLAGGYFSNGIHKR